MPKKEKTFYVTCEKCKQKVSDWLVLLKQIEPEEHQTICRICFQEDVAKPKRDFSW